MLRLYLIPSIHVPLSTGSYICPKYFPHRFTVETPELQGVTWEWEVEALGPVGLIVADVTPEQHTFLAALSDVLAIPVDRSVTTPARVTTYFQTVGIPTELIRPTVQETLRALLKYWAIHRGITGSLGLRPQLDRDFGGGVTMKQVLLSLADDVHIAIRIRGEDLA